MTAPVRPIDRPRHSRWTLRAKLIALVVGAAAAALVAVDVVLPLVTQSSLLSDRDATLNRVINELPQLGRDEVNSFITNPGNSPFHGEIGFSFVPTDPDGTIKVLTDSGDDNPDIGRTPPTVAPETVPDVGDTGETYRILAIGVTSQGHLSGYLVAWTPMSDVATTVHRLVLLELLATAVLLLLLGLLAGLIIRRELRPLETMARSADQIAEGDLKVRVPEEDPATEIGRLASAFNGMLDGIGSLLSDRAKGEERLRQFIADASHELRTPVAAVRGYSDLYLAGALPDGAAVDRAMTRMGSEALRMGSLVDDLLTLIRADAPEQAPFGPVELTAVLTEVVDDASAIDATRAWRVGSMPSPVMVSGDRMRLHQLFANLLGNVRTHTPAGVTATISALTGADSVAVVVSDNGPGVSDDNLGKIFDRFFRADPARSREKGGTGLGLSIVAAIVRAHGGQVHAGHTPGGGLTMTVVLPLAAGTAAVPDALREPESSSDDGPRTGPIPRIQPALVGAPDGPARAEPEFDDPRFHPAAPSSETGATSDIHLEKRVRASGNGLRR